MYCTYRPVLAAGNVSNVGESKGVRNSTGLNNTKISYTWPDSKIKKTKNHYEKLVSAHEV